MQTCSFKGVEIDLGSLGIKPGLPGRSPAYGLFRGQNGHIHVEHNGHVFVLPDNVTERDLLHFRSHQEVNAQIRQALSDLKPTGESYYDHYLPLGLAYPLWIVSAQAIGVTFKASIAFRNEEWARGTVAAAKPGNTPYDHNGNTDNPCEVFGKAHDTAHFHSHGGTLFLPHDAPELVLTEAEVKAQGGNRQGFSNEPEFTFLMSPSSRELGSRPLGYTVGNDATVNLWESRSMLNLYRTKVGDTMTGIAPIVRIFPDDTPLRPPNPTTDGAVYGEACPEIPLETKIVIQIHRGGKLVFSEFMVWEQMRRTLADLTLHSDHHTTRGANAWLLTGTGVAPFPIVRNDIVVIGMDGIGYFAAVAAKEQTGLKTKFSRYPA